MNKFKQVISITGVILGLIPAVCAAMDSVAGSVTKIQRIREGR